MEAEKSLAYLRAQKKVEILKAFYSHLVVYVIINSALILVSANVFNDKPIDFEDWNNYGPAFFWGFGLIAHAMYVFFVINVQDNFLKRWEDKKIKEILEEDF